MALTKEEEANQQNANLYPQQAPTSGLPVYGTNNPVYPLPPGNQPGLAQPQTYPVQPGMPPAQLAAQPDGTITQITTTAVGNIIINQPQEKYHKNTCDAYLLGFPLGFLGLHHFYLRRWGMAVTYMFTLGCFGIGMMVDWFRMPCLVKQANKRLNNPHLPEQRSLSDAYILWFPLGLLGFHRYYVGSYKMAVLYTFTLGGLGIGWIIDGFLLPSLVKKKNAHLLKEHELGPFIATKEVDLCTAYILCAIPPLGLLGVHHYYMRRPLWGVLYTCTLGLFGIGWLIDICRISRLVKRKNKEITNHKADIYAHVDDAYVLCFPLGFLGLHHYYLNRPGWGILYTFSFGLFGVGWVSDWFRLSCLVKDHNKQVDERAHLQATIQQNMPPGQNTVIVTNNNRIIAVNTPPNSYQQTLGPNNRPNGQYGSDGFTEVYTVGPPMPPAPGPCPPAYDSLPGQLDSIASSNVDMPPSSALAGHNQSSSGKPDALSSSPPPPYKKDNN